MTVVPIADELGALEQARSRLEAALAGDENWRALTQPGKGGDSAEARAARRARNARLEMALADNALYQAWKHVNSAIDALRAKSAAQSLPAAPLVRPAPAVKAPRGSAGLPDDVAALLREEQPEGTQRAVRSTDSGPEPAASGQQPSARARLVQRLERLEEAPFDAEAAPTARIDVDGSASTEGEARTQPRRAPVPADPPEATVTFVVRESQAPPMPAAEPSPAPGTERNSALLERVRNLTEVPALGAASLSPSNAGGEEAEVTIITAEGLKQRHEAEERGNIVRRFRKALSGY